MIDLHSHILWGLDDGARTLKDSLEMCRIAHGDGIKTIVATPHTLNGLYQNDRPSILTKVHELNRVISKQLSVKSSELSHQSSVTSPNNKSRITDNESPITNPQSAIPPGRRPLRAGGRNPKFNLLILPGSDVHLCDQTIRQLDGGKVTTLGDGGKFLLLEFPFQSIPYGAEEVLFQLLSREIIPIISHPERNLEIGQNPRRYSEMIRMGCLGQLTGMSLTNGFGPDVKRHAVKLLRRRLVHIIASDAHSTDGRPPVLSPAVHAAARIVGEEEAWKMVTQYPQAILKGQKPIRRTKGGKGR